MRANRSLIAVVIGVALMAAPTFANAQETGRPYLGVRLGPVPPMLLSQLQLPTGQGVVVDSVVADSPADRAGIAQYDVLLSVDGTLVTGPQAFVDDIRAARVGDDVVIELIHEGQPSTRTAKLEEQPEQPTLSLSGSPMPHPRDWDRLRRLFDRPPAMMGQLSGSSASQVHVERFTRDVGGTEQQWSVKIEGDPTDGTSTIEVQRDGDTWNTTVAGLDKLPKDLQPVVQEVLDRAEKDAVGSQQLRLDPLDTGRADSPWR